MKAKLLLLTGLFVFTSLCAQNPVVTCVTGKSVGTAITLKFRLKTAGNVQVDWGNGIKTTHAVTAHPKTTAVEGISAGSTIKVYNDELMFFECKNADLTSLDVSNALEIDIIFVDDNLLTNLDLSVNTKLRQLGLSGNPIASVDLKNKDLLTTVYLRFTQFEACALNAVFDALPEKSGTLKIFIEGNPGATTSETSIAVNKGWVVDIEGDGSGCTNSVNDDLYESARFILLKEDVLSFVGNETGSMMVIDTTGKTILQADNVNSLNVSGLAKGLYLVKYNISGISKTTKIIKR